MQLSYSSDGPGMKNIMAGIAALNGADALVGIPESNTGRKEGDIGNAALLFIFSNGSPLRGQHARPVIEPAIEQPETAERIARALAAASTAALDGNETGMLDALDRAGTIGESAAKRWFTDSRNGWPQNAVSTIRAKSGKKVMGPVPLVGQSEEWDSANTPGIDTGQMRRAITHVVEAGQGVHEGNSTNFAPDTEIGFGPQSEGEIAEVAEVAAI